MTRIHRALAFGGFLLAAAGVGPAQEPPPASGADPGAELRDSTMRVEAAGGLVVNTLYLDADGSMQLMEEPEGERVSGRWFVRDRRLCLEWEPRGRECWPYQAALVRGQTTRVTSDRGLSVRITLI